MLLDVVRRQANSTNSLARGPRRSFGSTRIPVSSHSSRPAASRSPSPVSRPPPILTQNGVSGALGVKQCSSSTYPVGLIGSNRTACRTSLVRS